MLRADRYSRVCASRAFFAAVFFDSSVSVGPTTGDLAAAEGGVGAGALVGQVHDDDVVQHLAVDLAAEVRGIDLDLADLGALEAEDRDAEAVFHFDVVSTGHGQTLSSRTPPVGAT